MAASTGPLSAHEIIHAHNAYCYPCALKTMTPGTRLRSGPASSVGYWIVVALGNVFIVGFEGLIVGIQTMRLSYYEFFSKFFRGGGMRFDPITLAPAEDE